MYQSARIVFIILFGILTGCSLFGEGPRQHTVVDYETISPAEGNGATVSEYQYGHTGTTHSGTGVEEERQRDR